MKQLEQDLNLNMEGSNQYYNLEEVYESISSKKERENEKEILRVSNEKEEAEYVTNIPNETSNPNLVSE